MFNSQQFKHLFDAYLDAKSLVVAGRASAHSQCSECLANWTCSRRAGKTLPSTRASRRSAPRSPNRVSWPTRPFASKPHRHWKRVLIASPPAGAADCIGMAFCDRSPGARYEKNGAGSVRPGFRTNLDIRPAGAEQTSTARIRPCSRCRASGSGSSTRWSSRRATRSKAQALLEQLESTWGWASRGQRSVGPPVGGTWSRIGRSPAQTPPQLNARIRWPPRRCRTSRPPSRDSSNTSELDDTFEACKLPSRQRRKNSRPVPRLRECPV